MGRERPQAQVEPVDKEDTEEVLTRVVLAERAGLQEVALEGQEEPEVTHR